MKKIILFTLLAPSVVFGQKKSNPWGKQESKIAKPYARINSGAVFMGLGTALVGGSVVLLGNAKEKKQSTGAYVLAGAGGLVSLIGGILVSDGAIKLSKMHKSTARKKNLRFSGTSFALVF